MKTQFPERLPAIALPLLLVGFVAIFAAVGLYLVGFNPIWQRWTIGGGFGLIVLGVAICLPALIREDRAKRAS